MIVKGALSPSQMESGRRNYNLFNSINGMSYICLGEMVIILFAIRMDTPNFCIAALGSFFFLANFFMPLGKLLVARVGGAKTMAYCWMMRNASALTVATAPLMAWLFHPYAGVVVIMTGAFGFYACRSAGIAGSQPLLGEVTTPENRGRFTSANARTFNISAMIMLALIIMLMKLSRETWVFDAIIVTGAVLGFISAFIIGRVNETESLRESARKPILDDMRLTLKNPMRLRQLIANCTINSAIALTVPISMLALKRSYGISDGDALFYAMLHFAGGIGVSYLFGLLAEETGPRPLAILFYSLTIVLCLLWVIGPDTFKWHYSIWPFLLAGSASMGGGISMTHYFLITVPPKERVAASLTISAMSGVVAGLVGSVVGGGLLKWLGSMRMEPVDMFKLYFLIVMALLLVGLFLVSKLEPKADWEVGDVLGLAFAPRDVLTLFSLYGREDVADPRQEREDIDSLMEMKSGLSERALLSYLDSPQFVLRGRALTALREIPFGHHAEKAVLKELKDGEHTTAHLAAEIAGDRGLTAAIPTLREHLDSDDYYLAAKCMVSLVRMSDSASYPRIKAMFKASTNPRIIIHGATALALIADDESLRLLLEKALSPDIPRKIIYEIIYSVARIKGRGDDIYKFLKLYTKDKASALMQLAEQCANPMAVSRLVSDKRNLESGDVLRFELLKAFKKAGGGRNLVIAEFLETESAPKAPIELLLGLLPLPGEAE